jgi:hypothetical protein
VELKKLYDYICKLNDTDMAIVESEELVSNPEAVLQAFCAKLDLEWDPRMVSWNAGEVKEFKTWPGFHVDVEESTGFHKPKEYKNEVLPSIVQETIEVNMPIYTFLKNRRLRLENGLDKN